MGSFLYIEGAMVSAEKNLEIEIKLELGSFTNYLKLIGFLGAIDREEHHVNGFFDSEDRQLAEAGWVLRIRAENDRGLVTLKSHATRRGAAMVRKEIEEEIRRPLAMEVVNLHLDVLSLAAAPIQFVRGEFPDITLARLVRFNNTRQKKQFRIGDYEYTLEIDKTEFSDGSVDYELEVELQDTSRIEIVEDGLRKLFSSLGILYARQDKSKYERALTRANLV